eukprot:7883805-Ditylum_brightwellii.AAC.1
MEWAILVGSLLQTDLNCGKDTDSHRDTQDIWNHFELKALEPYQCLDSACNAMQQDQTITPTQTIQSNWDIQMAINETVQELQIRLKTHHVYGHQDTRNTPNLMEDKDHGLHKHRSHKSTKTSKKKNSSGKHN